MSKSLFALICALAFLGLGGVATAEELAPVSEETLVLQAAIFSQPQGCAQDLSLEGVPAPTPMGQCSGGEGGSCDKRLDCQGYFCPLGSFRCCVGGTGSGCEGTCACC